jgi:hypothetical protein
MLPHAARVAGQVARDVDGSLERVAPVAEGGRTEREDADR